MPAVISDGPWPMGCNSLSEPTSLAKGEYQWGVNVVNRGGLIQTRPGFSAFQVPAGLGNPRGMAVFTPKNSVPHIVIAIGTQIMALASPFTGTFTQIEGLNFSTTGPVVFEQAIKNIDEAEDGTLTIIDPRPVLMISDGLTRTAYWDGLIARHLDPSKNETPPFKWMKYVGGRLWGSNGSKLRASNILNPLLMTEENILAQGGTFELPSEITGMGVTPDFNNLIVGTDRTTTSFQVSIVDRTQWQSTAGFQKLVFPNIGCAAGKSFVNQWGITWWYSHEGLIGLDEGIRTYRTSRIHFQDQDMMRSKGNMSPDISGICMGTFENYLVVSVPSGDIHNAHTWVMDQAVLDSSDSRGGHTWNGIWKGIRPIEWVTSVINGHARCFALSRDYDPDPVLNLYAPGDPEEPEVSRGNVWEMFIGERFDIGFNIWGDPKTKDIECNFETKLLGQDGAYKLFRFAEIDLSQISGVVQLRVSYAGKTGGYKLILEKQIIAGRAPIIDGQTTIYVDTSVISEYRPQNRTVRTRNEETVTSDDLEQGVESVYTRKKDVAFSLLIEWTGRMAVNSVRCYADPETQEPEGKTEENELTDRYVEMDGDEAILTTPPSVVYDGFNNESQYSAPNYPRWIDSDYKSLT